MGLKVRSARFGLAVVLLAPMNPTLAVANHTPVDSSSCTFDSAGTTEYDLKTCTATYYAGSEAWVRGPCRDGANVGGVCFPLSGNESSPWSITVQDATGKPVAGNAEFAHWECFPSQGCFWVTNNEEHFCSGSGSYTSPIGSNAQYVEVELGYLAGSVRWICGPEINTSGEIKMENNFTGGTVGTVTVTFRVPEGSD